MTAGATLFRISIDLSDVTRGVYERLDLRIPLHPSEDAERLVTRCLAYCLFYEPGLALGKGLADADDPSLHVTEGGQMSHWIDVGTPSAERMHRASKHATKLTVVCHKGAEPMRREREKRKIHNVERVGVVLIDVDLVRSLAKSAERNTNWVVVRNDGELLVTVAQGTSEQSFSGSIEETTLSEV